MKLFKAFFNDYDPSVSDDELDKAKNQIISGYKKFYKSHIDDLKKEV